MTQIRKSLIFRKEAEKRRGTRSQVTPAVLWNVVDLYLTFILSLVVSATSLLSSSCKGKICPDEDKLFNFLTVKFTSWDKGEKQREPEGHSVKTSTLACWPGRSRGPGCSPGPGHTWSAAFWKAIWLALLETHCALWSGHSEPWDLHLDNENCVTQCHFQF